MDLETDSFGLHALNDQLEAAGVLGPLREAFGRTINAHGHGNLQNAFREINNALDFVPPVRGVRGRDTPSDKRMQHLCSALAAVTPGEGAHAGAEFDAADALLLSASAPRVANRRRTTRSYSEASGGEASGGENESGRRHGNGLIPPPHLQARAPSHSLGSGAFGDEDIFHQQDDDDYFPPSNDDQHDLPPNDDPMGYEEF